MNRYIVEGGNRLNGEVVVSGSKNASLPIIAACILNKGKVEIKNCPQIRDVEMMIEILKRLGCTIEREKHVIKIDANGIHSDTIPEELMHEMRSSVIIVGALLGRLGSAKFTYPGGCEIGSRPINMHLEAFKKLGVELTEECGKIDCRVKEMKANTITLSFPSVGATENIMLASVMAEGTTCIINAAKEPEIVCLQDFLCSMGAKVYGAGTNTIFIQGKTRWHDTSYTVIPDRIEAGTYLCMASGCGGEVVVKNVVPEHINSILYYLKMANCKIGIAKNEIYLKSKPMIFPLRIKTKPYPGFPTDMQSQFVTLLSTANGTSTMIETIFENRFKYISELNSMGANIRVHGKTAIIQGVPQLKGASIQAKDLRGGAALICASLMAEGVSTIDGAKYVKRGYENLIEKLTILGAKLKEE